MVPIRPKGGVREEQAKKDMGKMIRAEVERSGTGAKTSTVFKEGTYYACRVMRPAKEQKGTRGQEAGR